MGRIVSGRLATAGKRGGAAQGAREVARAPKFLHELLEKMQFVESLFLF